jgi:hypothetical protein
MAAGEKQGGGPTSSGLAIFSACGQYRYLLTRRISEHEKIATFIMLNPSTADATHNDPTIRKCIGFARRWQCGTLQVLNLFGVRAMFPQEMKQAVDPVGPENQHWFHQVILPESTAANLVICAWGVHGNFKGQDKIILDWLEEVGIRPFALGVTRQGHPRHPLYLPYAIEPVLYILQRD